MSLNILQHLKHGCCNITGRKGLPPRLPSLVSFSSNSSGGGEASVSISGTFPQEAVSADLLLCSGSSLDLKEQNMRSKQPRAALLFSTHQPRKPACLPLPMFTQGCLKARLTLCPFPETPPTHTHTGRRATVPAAVGAIKQSPPPPPPRPKVTEGLLGSNQIPPQIISEFGSNFHNN